MPPSRIPLTDYSRPKKKKRAAAEEADKQPLLVLGTGDYALTRVGEVVSSGHLSYVLSEPVEPGGALEGVGVGSTGRFVVSVKNPGTPNAGGAGLSDDAKARFPPAALAAFKGKTGRDLAWVNCSACPDLLNTVHAEALFIASNPVAESDAALAESLAAAAKADHEEHIQAGGGGGEEEGKEEDPHYKEVLAALKDELRASEHHLDVRPAVTGEFM